MTSVKQALLVLSFFLLACNGGGDDKVPSDQVDFVLDFSNRNQAWAVGFADYPIDATDESYELGYAIEAMPTPLNIEALKVTGNNHSDDLFMFVSKQFAGLKPNQRYDVSFALGVASNAPSGCSGVGGAPGESVTIKAGASKIQPLRIEQNQYWRMNIDKSNQTNGGSDMMVLGDYANGEPCQSPYLYIYKELESNQPFSVESDENGRIWLVFGTDSGFESTTAIYYVDGEVTFRERTN